jgi:hypothetical protein
MLLSKPKPTFLIINFNNFFSVNHFINFFLTFNYKNHLMMKSLYQGFILFGHLFLILLVNPHFFLSKFNKPSNLLLCIQVSKTKYLSNFLRLLF